MRESDSRLLAEIDRGLDLLGEPLYWSENAHWMIEIFGRSAEKGIGTLLTGQMGNSTVSFEGFKRDTGVRIFREHLAKEGDSTASGTCTGVDGSDIRTR